MRTNLIGLYGGGTLSDFTKPFQENEDLYNQAKIYWNHLNQ
jgi:hypothetical protein